MTIDIVGRNWHWRVAEALYWQHTTGRPMAMHQGQWRCEAHRGRSQGNPMVDCDNQ